jgi:hypothetical protein
MSHSETAYNNWVHDQLEPTDRLPRHSKGEQDYTPAELVRIHQKQADNIQQEEEHNAEQDAYLKSKGI